MTITANVAKNLALEIAVLCVRNTCIEDLRKSALPQAVPPRRLRLPRRVAAGLPPDTRAARRGHRARRRRGLPPRRAQAIRARAGHSAAPLRGERPGLVCARRRLGGVVARGPRRGRYIIRVRVAPAAVDAFALGRLRAKVGGFNLQSATRIGATDRAGLKRMARHLARRDR